MITISLCMIVKNEEAVLARCLDSIHDIVDEINIIDTGSTDSTVEIAKRYTDRVFFFPWTGSFAEARTESFKHATKEYLLYLDADDVILDEDREKLRKLKETLDPSVDSVSMFYDAGTDAYGNVTLRYRRNRMVRRDRNFQWQGEAHQYLNVFGKIINENISVTHKKIKHSVGRNLSIYKTRIERGDTFSARDYFYYGNELRENGHPEEAIKAYDKNIEMKEGWVEDKFYACINKGDCYRALGDSYNELASLLQSFQFTRTPRPEACSRIGYNFQKSLEYKHAIFWYDLATKLQPDDNQWSFSYPAYSTWYPHLQMCLCYSKIGELEKANEHNELAATFRPNDASILHNRKWFEGKVKPKEESKSSAEDEVS